MTDSGPMSDGGLASRADEWLEVVPGKWFLAARSISWRLPSGHRLHVRPGVHEGRVVAREVRIASESLATEAERERPSASDEWTVGAGPITSEVLRSVTLDKFYEQVPEMLVDEQGRFTLLRHLVPANVERLRENGPTTETLEIVADVYRIAHAFGQQPTKAVEERFEIPRSTAGRWVAKARKLGLLGEAPRPGKAGI